MSSPEYQPVESPDASTVFEYHDLTPPTTADVYRARKTIREFIPQTPLVRSERLSTKYNAEVYLKREDTLPTGSFKIRGATNLIANIDEKFHERGVITASTGNYGRAIAHAARRFDIPAIIVVPEGTGQNQIDSIEQLGARVEILGTDYDESREWAEQQAAEQGYRYAHPGNERLVIAGAGTGGLEIAEALPEVDTVLCPVGAGSVGAGYSLSVGTVTDARMIGVQATDADAVYQAWQTGDLTPQENADTFAEGIGARVPFTVPLEIMREQLDAMFTSSESEIIETVAALFAEERILIEGACAPPISIMDQLQDDLVGETIAIPVTGRNLPLPKVRQVFQTDNL
ncbi:threonine/serine dehydratase (plasmid) [Halococcus dombrowskii]|uniref:Threonine ammonia-lyase n=1 Tax=Halococcus dombrowskii TaxID=179637 RepID=A0AAV3SE16_HALDO|nr:threonine/serine dehydratase [Halococcus dombrowskii]UOO96818.1 threonine/serine dehydratase [Halococcus dombrowskii]